MASKKTRVLTPAALCVARFGGVRKAARAIGVDHSRVVRWRKSEGGRIPSKHQRPLLDAAREQGVELTAAELITGGAA